MTIHLFYCVEVFENTYFYRKTNQNLERLLLSGKFASLKVQWTLSNIYYMVGSSSKFLVPLLIFYNVNRKKLRVVVKQNISFAYRDVYRVFMP